MAYILAKNHEDLTKTKEVTFFFSLKSEVARKTPAVTIFYSMLFLLQQARRKQLQIGGAHIIFLQIGGGHT